MVERDRTLRLRDGRTLGYAEYGAPRGKPLFFFHGFPGSRLEAQLTHAVAARQGVRIIAPDRPGFGLSDFKRRRTILDWPSDVLELADALGIDRFAVVGVSGGGPYAAACALRIPERLVGAAIVSGIGPLDAPAATRGMMPPSRVVLALVRRLPWLARLPMWLLGQAIRRWPERMLALTSRSIPSADREVLARPEIKTMFLDDVVESFRQGSRAAAWEVVLYARPWGFRPEDIAMEVHLWHGEVDVNVPLAMGRYQAEAIPNCRARFYPGEGHLLAVNRVEEVQSALFAGR